MKVDLLVEIDLLEEDASSADIQRLVQEILQRELRYLNVTVQNAEDY